MSGYRVYIYIMGSDGQFLRAVEMVYFGSEILGLNDSLGVLRRYKVLVGD